MADFYELLGVPPSATQAEIRQAYLRIAKDRHPDRFVDPVQKEKAQEVFRDLTTAFNTLTNQNSRRQYDEERERPQPRTPDEIAADAHARGIAAFQGGQLDEAVTLLRTAVHHAPNESGYHATLGRVLGRIQGGGREAISCLEKAVQLAPRTASHHLDLAQLLASQGLRLRAQRALGSALQLAPNDPQARRLAEQLGLP